MVSGLPIRRMLAIIVTGVVLSGAGITAAQPAQALACVLGPSLASAAKSVGISCPDTDIDGGSGPEHWGAAGGGCNFGWDSTAVAPGMLDFLSASSVTRSIVRHPDGSKFSFSTYRKNGRMIGAIGIDTNPDRTFSIFVDVYNRMGPYKESLFFDCKTSKNGPMMNLAPLSDPRPMQVIGSPPAPMTDGTHSSVSTTGAMTQLGTNGYLLRLDATNSGATANLVDFELDLDGYRVDGFPSVPAGMTFEPNEGLICHLDSILPGQTVTLVLLLRPDGDDAGAAEIGVALSSMGAAKAKAHIGAARVFHTAVVTSFFEIDRP